MSQKELSSSEIIALLKLPPDQLRTLINRTANIKPISKQVRWKDGVITLSVTSDGTTGEAWISRLEDRGFKVGRYSKQLLTSKDFKPTKGITTQISILKGELFTDEDRITKNIRSQAEKRKLQKPNPEVACLIREYLSDDDIKSMGLWCLVVMHEPIKDICDVPGLLGVCHSYGDDLLYAYFGFPSHRWDLDSGFVFASAQVSS